jgi:hypothetical protein
LEKIREEVEGIQANLNKYQDGAEEAAYAA